MLTEAILRKMWPNGDAKVPGLVAGIAAVAPVVFPKYGLTSDLVIAHAMAQFSHECGAGLEMTENINYSAERAVAVWPLRNDDKFAYRHFKDVADCYQKCKSWPGDPDFHRKLINLVYGDRNGNHAGTDDGYHFIGRGLSQVTGRGNYTALAVRLGLDLVNDPALVNDPVHALECGVADFVMCGCLPYAFNDNVSLVTQRLNGGITGLDQRKIWLTRWKQALLGSPPVPKTPQPPLPSPAPPVNTNTKVAGAVVTGTAAAASAHQFGLSPLLVVAAAMIVAAIAFLIIHKATNKGS